MLPQVPSPRSRWASAARGSHAPLAVGNWQRNVYLWQTVPVMHEIPIWVNPSFPPHVSHRVPRGTEGGHVRSGMPMSRTRQLTDDTCHWFPRIDEVRTRGRVAVDGRKDRGGGAVGGGSDLRAWRARLGTSRVACRIKDTPRDAVPCPGWNWPPAAGSSAPCPRRCRLFCSACLQAALSWSTIFRPPPFICTHCPPRDP